jgi:hypothetical protein
VCTIQIKEFRKFDGLGKIKFNLNWFFCSIQGYLRIFDLPLVKIRILAPETVV